MGDSTSIVMATGIERRFFGSITQLELVVPNSEIIIDYLIYDVIEADFNKFGFVLNNT